MSTLESPCSIPTQICNRIELKIASTRTEWEAAFALTYQSYLQTGLCKPNPIGLRITCYQLLSTSDIFIAKLDNEVISTLTLVRDSQDGLPMEQVYPGEVADRRRKGARLAEITCLADRRKDPARFFGMFSELCRLMAQYAHKMGTDQLLVAVHPRHAKIYQRCMGFQQIGGYREYSAVQGNPAVALCRDLKYLKMEQPVIWERFFGQQLPDEALIGQPISGEDRRYFLELQAQTESMATIPPLANSLNDDLDWELADAFQPELV